MIYLFLFRQEEGEVIIETERAGTPVKAESPIPVGDNREGEKIDSDQEEQLEKVGTLGWRLKNVF